MYLRTYVGSNLCARYDTVTHRAISAPLPYNTSLPPVGRIGVGGVCVVYEYIETTRHGDGADAKPPPLNRVYPSSILLECPVPLARPRTGATSGQPLARLRQSAHRPLLAWDANGAIWQTPLPPPLPRLVPPWVLR